MQFSGFSQTFVRDRSDTGDYLETSPAIGPTTVLNKSLMTRRSNIYVTGSDEREEMT
jgi:hypothetical protein